MLPTLCGVLSPGVHQLVTAVYADTRGDVAGFDRYPTQDELELLGIPHEAFAASTAKL